MVTPIVLTTDITPVGITISWTRLTTAAQTGNCSVSNYIIEWAATTTYATLATVDSSNTNYVWTNTTVLFALGTTYNLRIKAQNTAGTATASPSLNILTDTIPGTMTIYIALAAHINPENIMITWTNLTTDA